MSFEFIEYLFILIVIGAQLAFFAFSYFRIRGLTYLYPQTAKFQIVGLLGDEKTQEKTRVDVIKEEDGWSSYFKGIVKETNSYLISNKSTVASFEIIKDISERENNKLERSISAVIPVPLYIGLIGTMIGIVFGLSLMGSLENLNDASKLNPLLSGVKIAMMGSIFGLSLTLISSAFLFRRAKFTRDIRRNQYYNFIQMNLLPVLSTDPNSSIARNLAGIERKLALFNTNFKANTLEFHEVVGGIMKGINHQLKYIQVINQMDFEGISKSVHSMYGNIAENLIEFKKFNDYQTSLNASLKHHNSSVQGVEKVFTKVASVENTVKVIFGDIQEKVVAANRVMEFIEVQYKGIQGVSDFTKSLISDQQRTLSGVYEEFKAFLDETKVQFSDWSKNSVVDAKEEMAQLSTDLKKGITDTFDEVKDKIDDVYANDRLLGIQKDISDVKSTLDVVSKTEESAAKIDRALGKMNESISQLSAISETFQRANRNLLQTNYWEMVKRTVVQTLSVFALGAVGYITFYFIELIVGQ